MPTLGRAQVSFGQSGMTVTNETFDPMSDSPVVSPFQVIPEGQVYNIKEFQSKLSSYNKENRLSDYYGNARVANGKLKGTIGVKFGVRLVYNPPKGFHYDSPHMSDGIPQKERTYKFGKEVLIGGGAVVPAVAIPVAVFEQDVLDRKIGNIDLVDENMGEDLKCYIDRLTKTNDFQVVFGLCFPIRSYVSLFGLYGYYGFFDSIAADPENLDEMDEEPADFKEMWKGRIFKRTKKKLRRLFNSTYRTDDDAAKERRNFKIGLNANFLGNILPTSYFGLDGSVSWWQRLRMVNIRPIDADGDQCKNDFQKMFS